MLQVTVLDPGARDVARIESYPFTVGRASDDQLQIEAPGVWDHHFTLEWRGPDGIYLVGGTDSLTAVNGQLVKETRVGNGDLVQIGAARLLLSVAPAGQRSFRILEVLLWTALGGVALAQLYLMFLGLP